MTKLPKWAQRRIEVLERDLEYAHQQLSAGPEDSNVFADPYSDTLKPLGKDVSVEFVLREGDDRRPSNDSIFVRLETQSNSEPHLVVMSNRSLLAVCPRSSNMIHLVTTDR